MDDRIIAIYCLCDDCLKALHQRDDSQCTMSDTEVLTTAVVAAVFFRGNLESARAYLRDEHWIPQMLSKSRFNRRWHRVRELLLALMGVLSETWKALHVESVYSLDTFPVSVCGHYRIPCAKIYREEAYRGSIASQQRYFYGWKIHLLVTATGQPVEFFLTPGSCGEVGGLEYFDWDLPAGSIVYADRGYADYGFEDAVRELAQIEFQPMRKKNAKRQFPAWVQYLQHHFRKRIETTASLLERLWPKSIHAVTALGFELKVVLFVLAVSINCL